MIRSARTAFIARHDLEASTWARENAALAELGDYFVGGIKNKDEPPFYVVLDQGCDIAKPSCPFVHVSPVFNAARMLSGDDLGKVVSRSGFDYLYRLTASDLELKLTAAELDQNASKLGDGKWVWVADLRIQIPLDKGVLVGATCLSGFAEARERLAFGAELAMRSSRPAVPMLVEDDIIPILTTQAETAASTLGKVHIRVRFDSEVWPTFVEFVVIVPDDLVPTDVVNEFNGILGELTIGSGVPCSLAAVGHENEVFVRDYVSSVPIALDSE